MKRRMETTLTLVFRIFDKDENAYVGAATNLPSYAKAKTGKPLRVVSVQARSTRGGTEGGIHVQFDDFIGADAPSFPPTLQSLIELVHKWHEERLIDGSIGYCSEGVNVEFLLTRRENSFCDAAMHRALAILKSLGVDKAQIKHPEVHQETYVWVPKDKYAPGKPWGWVKFGDWLGERYQLSAE